MGTIDRLTVTVEATDTTGEYRVSTMSSTAGASRALPSGTSVVQATSLGGAAMTVADPRVWMHESNIINSPRCLVRSYRTRRSY